MSNEGRIHPALSIELLFEREDDKRFIDVIAQQAHAPLPPRPELWRDIVHGGNAALLHLPGNAPVERRRVDDDGEIGLAPVRFAQQVPVQSEDFR